MASGDGFLYNSFKAQIVKAEHNFGSTGHTFKVALFTNSLVPDKDSHSSYTQLTAFECAGNGYTVGGVTLANLTVLVDNASDTALVDADNATWNNLGELNPQPKWAVLYNDSHLTKALIACWEIGTLTNGGNWEMQFSSSPAAMFTLA